MDVPRAELSDTVPVNFTSPLMYVLLSFVTVGETPLTAALGKVPSTVTMIAGLVELLPTLSVARTVNE